MSTHDASTEDKASQRLPVDVIAAAEEADWVKLRALSMAERAELLDCVCRDATALEEARRRMGLPESVPAPWPQSTWDFLREQTQRARKQR